MNNSRSIGLKKNTDIDRPLNFVGCHHTLDEDDNVSGTSEENESDEEELKESKKQHVVLETDAQTKRFINAVATKRWDDDFCSCDEIYEPPYQADKDKNKVERFLNKIKPYSVILQDMSVYGFYKWCMKNDVRQLFQEDWWPCILQEKFHAEAAQDALKEPEDE
ncbi:hypothetical protein MBANPS3_011418 [Mucor bainieri]